MVLSRPVKGVLSPLLINATAAQTLSLGGSVCAKIPATSVEATTAKLYKAILGGGGECQSSGNRPRGFDNINRAANNGSFHQCHNWERKQWRSSSTARAWGKLSCLSLPTAPDRHPSCPTPRPPPSRFDCWPSHVSSTRPIGFMTCRVLSLRQG